MFDYLEPIDDQPSGDPARGATEPEGHFDSPTEPGPSLGRRVGHALRDALEAVALALALFFGLQLTIQNTVVEGSSMLPTLHNGQRVLVDKVSYRLSLPKRGDIVVFHAPTDGGKDFVKRIVGLPGEQVEIRDGQVLINGAVLHETWASMPFTSDYAPEEVPEHSYFVLGDNRPNSSDSRTWGMLEASRIVGKAWLSMWPPQRWGQLGPRQHPTLSPVP